MRREGGMYYSTVVKAVFPLLPPLSWMRLQILFYILKASLDRFPVSILRDDDSYCIREKSFMAI